MEFRLEIPAFTLGGLGSLIASEVSIPLSPSSALRNKCDQKEMIQFKSMFTFFCHFCLFSARTSVQGLFVSLSAPRPGASTADIMSPQVPRVGITIKSMKP